MASANPTKTRPDPIGEITEIHGPVVVVECTPLPPLHQALWAASQDETYLFEVHQHLDEHRIRAIVLHYAAGLERGTPVYDSGSPLHVPVATGCLGRVLNIFGAPLDGLAPLETREFPQYPRPPAAAQRGGRRQWRARRRASR